MGILNRRGDGDLCGQMKHHIRIANDGLHRTEVADISTRRSESVMGMLVLKPAEVGFTASAAQAIKNRHIISITYKVVDEIGANEAGSTSHDNTAWNHMHLLARKRRLYAPDARLLLRLVATHGIWA